MKDSVWDNIIQIFGFDSTKYFQYFSIDTVNFEIEEDEEGVPESSVFAKLFVHKKQTIRQTDIDYKGLDDIISEVGGYITSFKTIFGLIVLPFLYLAFINSLTKFA